MYSSSPDPISRYTFFEASAKASLPAEVIRAYSCALWNTDGYPHSITSLRELWRYHDGMNAYPSFLPRYSFVDNLPICESDYELLDKAASIVYEFSLKFNFPNFGPASINLLQQFFQYIMLRRIYPDPKLHVFEVGPGTGYLGLLLGLAGHSYHCLDISQAFFMYQYHLFSFAFGSRYDDSLERDNYHTSVGHIPWWKFASKGFKLPFNVNVACMNHNLREIHPLALKHILHVISRSPICERFSILADYLGNSKVGGATLHQVIADSPFLGYQLDTEYYALLPKHDAPLNIERYNIPTTDPSTKLSFSSLISSRSFSILSKYPGWDTEPLDCQFRNLNW